MAGKRPMWLGRVTPLLVAVLIASCTRGPTVDDVVARHVAARGGLERIEAVQSLRLTGRVTAGPVHQARVVREIQRPGRIRTEFTFQGVTAVRACDGETCWQVAPLQGRFDPEPMSPEAARETRAQADIAGPLIGWRDKGHQVTLVGRERLDGRDVYRLETTLADGTVRRDLVDVESHLLARTETQRLVAGRLRDATLTFGDERTVEGLLFAHSLEIMADGAPNPVRVELEKVEINPSLDDARFRMPPSPGASSGD